MRRLLFSFLILLSLAGACRAQTQSTSQPSPQSHDRVVQLLKELTEAPGPPGSEESVRKIMTERMHPLADSVMILRTDSSEPGGPGASVSSFNSWTTRSWLCGEGCDVDCVCARQAPASDRRMRKEKSRRRMLD